MTHPPSPPLPSAANPGIPARMSATVTPKNTLPADYPRGTWDEMVATDGRVNPAWSHVAAWLGGLSPEQAGATSAEIRRLLRENGVTYSVHGAPGGEHRAWQLDAVPWIVSEQDWKTVEAGLIAAGVAAGVVAAGVGPRILTSSPAGPAASPSFDLSSPSRPSDTTGHHMIDRSGIFEPQGPSHAP